MKNIRLIKDIRSYILDEEFKLIYLKNKVNIINYKSIGHFDSTKVIVRSNDFNVIIKGSNLVVTRLVNDEILITGTINNIEFR